MFGGHGSEIGIWDLGNGAGVLVLASRVWNLRSGVGIQSVGSEAQDVGVGLWGLRSAGDSKSEVRVLRFEVWGHNFWIWDIESEVRGLGLVPGF